MNYSFKNKKTYFHRKMVTFLFICFSLLDLLCSVKMQVLFADSIGDIDHVGAFFPCFFFFFSHVSL